MKKITPKKVVKKANKKITVTTAGGAKTTFTYKAPKSKPVEVVKKPESFWDKLFKWFS